MAENPFGSGAASIREEVRRLNAATPTRGISEYLEMLTEDFLMTDSSDPEHTGRGHEPLIAFVKELKAAMPDAQMAIRRIICSGRVVAWEGVIAGAHVGAPLFGHPASGRPVSWMFCSFNEVSEETGKVESEVNYYDTASLHQQLAGAGST